MEFKGILQRSASLAVPVDIGTEWNLKCEGIRPYKCKWYVDIGTEWNLKFME